MPNVLSPQLLTAVGDALRTRDALADLDRDLGSLDSLSPAEATTLLYNLSAAGLLAGQCVTGIADRIAGEITPDVDDAFVRQIAHHYLTEAARALEAAELAVCHAMNALTTLGDEPGPEPRTLDT